MISGVSRVSAGVLGLWWSLKFPESLEPLLVSAGLLSIC